MATTLDATSLTLNDVHRLLKLERRMGRSLDTYLTLEPLTESEQRDLDELQISFAAYYDEGKILEGQIQFLFVSPLLWLSGFQAPNIKLALEVGISEIEVEDEETIIKGRLDILAAKRVQNQAEINIFWVLIVESKNSSLDASEGLPQLLSYAYTGIQNQDSVWGLTTNGLDYQFVYIERGKPSTYQIFPKLSFLYPDQSRQVLQVLKAIAKL